MEFSAIIPEIFCLIAILIFCSYCCILSLKSFDFKFTLLFPSIHKNFILILIFIFCLFLNNPINITHLFFNSMFLEIPNLFFKICCLIFFFFLLLVSKEYSQKEKFIFFEYFLLIMFLLWAIFGLLDSNDLIIIYLFLELQTLCVFLLVALKRSSEFSTEAGLKYFIVGILASGFFLFGVSFLYGFCGTTNLSDLIKIVANFNFLVTFFQVGIITGLFFIIIAIFLKISLVPFHLWLIDIYEGSSFLVTFLLAVPAKFAILGLAFKFFFLTFQNIVFIFQHLFFLSVALSLIFGSLGAIGQLKLKRFLGYSSINNLAYAILALSLVSIEGLQGFFFFFLIYMIANSGIFIILIGCRNKCSRLKLLFISDLNSISQINPLLAFTFSFFILSIAGIPPLGGFFGKYYIILSLIQSELFGFVFVVLAISIFSAFYYIRFIKTLFFEPIIKNSFLLLNNLKIEFAYSLGFISFIIFFFFFIHFGFFDLFFFLSYTTSFF